MSRSNDRMVRLKFLRSTKALEIIVQSYTCKKKGGVAVLSTTLSLTDQKPRAYEIDKYSEAERCAVPAPEEPYLKRYSFGH